MKAKAVFLCLIFILAGYHAHAQDGSRLEKWRELKETREHRKEGRARMDAPAAGAIKDTFKDRDLLVHVASNAPPANRAMVIVLHGGMGNANHIYSIIGQDLNDAADEGGFVVAYLNGSGATRRDNDFHAWNAGGGCCGQPFKQNVDDVGYITGAVAYLSEKYKVDPKKVFGMGHSNGAIMVQRLMCQTDVFQAIIPISGPLNIDAQSCPPAYHKKILAVHGTLDNNVPINGGYGTKGVTDIDYKSQAYSKGAFEESSAAYTIDAVEGADHSLQTIIEMVAHREGRTFGRYAALFFGLAPKQ